MRTEGTKLMLGIIRDQIYAAENAIEKIEKGAIPERGQELFLRAHLEAIQYWSDKTMALLDGEKEGGESSEEGE